MAEFTCRPTGDGDKMEFTYSGTAWQNVSDQSDSTHITGYKTTEKRGLFQITPQIPSNHVIDSVVAYMRYIGSIGNVTNYCAPLFKIGGVEYLGSWTSFASYDITTKEVTFLNSPATSAAWTPSEINNMQFGCAAKSFNINVDVYVKELWLVITTTPKARGTILYW